MSEAGATGKAVKLAAADCILTFFWTIATASLGAISLAVGDYLNWEGDRAPLLYSIILIVNLIFVEMAVASGGAAWNPTAPMAFWIAGASQETLAGVLLRIPAMAIGAAGGIWGVHQLMPVAYNHTLGPGPSLKSDVHIHLGAFVEGTLSFLLTFAVLYIVLRATNNRFLQTPIIVTCALTLVRFAGGYTGPAINPTDAFGWAYFNSQHTSKEHLYVYWMSPFIGALAAAAVFRLLIAAPALSPLPPSDTGEKEE